MKLWFLTAEELGEFIGMRFGRLPPGATEAEWMFPRHADYDGVGWFAENLRRRGAVLERLPTIRHPADPPKMAMLRLLPKYLKPKHRLKWGPLERGSGTRDCSKPPRAVAWHLFDEEATTQIRRVCRNFEVTVNSFLLKHLTKAIRPSLEDQSAAVPWMVPINMRGKVKQVRETANYTSYIRIEVQSYETVHNIHQNIYDALCRGEHWANWQAYQLGRFLTAGMRRYLVAAELATPQWTLGGFSNMGDWDPGQGIHPTRLPGRMVRLPAGVAFPTGGRRLHDIPKPPEPDNSNPPGPHHRRKSPPTLDAELGQGNRNGRGEHLKTPDRRTGLGLEFESGRNVEGVVECLVSSVRRGSGSVIGNSAPAVGKVIGDRPIPMPAMMAKPDAAKVQIGVRNKRVKIGIRAGIFIVDITRAGEITLAELPRDAEFVDKTGLVIQGDCLSPGRKRRALQGDLLYRAPFSPIQVEFKIPVGCRPERNAADDKLRKINGGAR